MHLVRRADSRTVWAAGNSIDSRMPIIAMTTSSSTNVNAERRLGKFRNDRRFFEKFIARFPTDL